MCRVWCGRDNWATLALVIDCHTRELLGWHLSRSGRSKTAESALEQALIARYGHLGRVQKPFLLRSDNGLVFTSRSYTALVKTMGCSKSSSPHTPRSKTAWSSESSEPSSTNAFIVIDSKAFSTPVVSSGIGSVFITTGALIRR